MVGGDLSRTRSPALAATVWGRGVGHRAIDSRVLEVAVSFVASAVIAMMVALGGSAVQVTNATPLQVGTPGPRFFLDHDYSPEGERIFRTTTPTPNPMTWCRPLSGSTICISETS